MKEFLFQTAWPMTVPLPYSAFHIFFTVTGIGLAFWLSRKLSRSSEKTFRRILLACGLILAVSELYKQLFLYYVVNGEHYDWWYFPFQLCSLPMYFCLLLPLLPSKQLYVVILTFMQDFNLLGGVMALAEPSGLLHPYWTLTLHGLLWHILLIFIGLLTSFSGHSERSIKGFAKTLPLFGICCLIASFINIFTHTRGDANMFYISPYYPTSQIVFHEIALKFGVMAGNVAYLLSICLGGFLFHMLMRRFKKPDMTFI